MILRNYYGFWGGFLGQPLSNGQSKTITGCKTLTGNDLICYTPSATGYMTSFIANVTSWNGCAVRVGTDNTTEDISDYCLGNDVTANLTNYLSNLSVSYGDNGAIFTFTVSGENRTGSTITIKEIGITKKYFSSPTAVSEFLITREVLDTPIVLNDGDAFSFTYIWKQQ